MTRMRHRRLGDSGLAVSVLGLGCNNFGFRLDQAGASEIVATCLDLGMNVFDTADYYGDSELILGRALQGRRDQAVIATKFGLDLEGRLGPDWNARGSRRYIRKAVESSLQRLGTDYIDLYQMHRPDGRTPIGETLSVLSDLVREGKVRYIGCSNFAGWQIADADWVARTSGFERFVGAQNRFNLIERGVENDVLPACRRFGVGLLPWYPLANGLLTGKYRRNEAPPEGARLTDAAIPWHSRTLHTDDMLDDEAFDAVEPIAAFAEERGLSLLEVAIGGLIAQPGVACAIAGATSPEQVRANAAAASWSPTADDLKALDQAAPRGSTRVLKT